MVATFKFFTHNHGQRRDFPPLLTGQIKDNDMRGTVKQQPVARNLMVVAINTIKITVEQQRQILAVHPYKVHMVQMGQGE